ncbi:hypothetical protein PMI06_005453 [Burkholderia sp. BT03]|nr:hypothetical protein PMI06_005453 [Burkholderia sp. BT03]
MFAGCMHHRRILSQLRNSLLAETLPIKLVWENKRRDGYILADFVASMS